MEGFLKFLGLLVIGAIALIILSGIGPLGAIIVFFIIGSAILGQQKNDRK